MTVLTQPDTSAAERPAPVSTIPENRLRVALFGIFGVQNLGNECTLQAMLYNLRNRLPEAELYSICYEPEDTCSRHGLPAVPIRSRYETAARSDAGKRPKHRPGRVLRLLFRRAPAELADWFRAARTLSGTELLLMTGTGMLTDYSTSAFGYAYDVFKWTVAARLAGCKVRFVGVGVGPIYERLSRWFFKAALWLADYRSYRDDFSRKRLAQLNIRTAPDPVFPDLAFSLPTHIFPARQVRSRQQRMVGLGVMNFQDPHASTPAEQRSAYDAYLDKMCGFMVFLLERGYQLCILQGDARFDGTARAELRKRAEQRGLNYELSGIIDENSASVEDLLRQLAQVDVVISPRFHNLILAMMLGVPVISISYDPKSDVLLQAAGLENCCQTMATLNVKRLVEQFLYVEEKTEEIRTHLRSITAEYRHLLNQQYDLILEDLRERSRRPGKS
jgi:polysaccharide pyruvyl transferase WcaK-like protein